jgi:hypothetical protein
MMVRSDRYDEHRAIPSTAAAHVDLERLQNESIFSLSKSCAAICGIGILDLNLPVLEVRKAMP